MPNQQLMYVKHVQNYTQKCLQLTFLIQNPSSYLIKNQLIAIKS